MLLELTQSPLAIELRRANEEIVRLLEAIAAEGADYESAMRAWNHPGKPPKASVEAVLALSREEREALRRAVEVDVEFDAAFDDEGFAFAFPALDDKTRKAGKQLLTSMYDSVFSGAGFSLPANPVVNRVTWELAFREANPLIKVCPACLVANLEWRIEGRAATDADHYLPRTYYPALSVHGLNLVPTCKPCNQTAKGQKDPLASDAAPFPLSSVWFPYRDAGIDRLEVDFHPTVGSVTAIVSLEGKDGDERKVELFDALFHLSSRWSEILPSIHTRIARQVIDRLEGPSEIPSVGALLRRMSVTMKRELENTPGEYVAGCYCAWLVNTRPALAKFVAELDSYKA
jgi:hypothetical protein